MADQELAPEESFPSTKPKPLVFVLMPFAPKFDEVYKLGIKAAVQEAGGHAERLDEQIFAESMLERIYSQIAKADVIVADMTGRNSNVFYEVGYAHALNKVVLLLTQDAKDIPFDLKHHQHLVYEGNIINLKSELVHRVAWALREVRRRETGADSAQVSVSCAEIVLSAAIDLLSIPELNLFADQEGWRRLPLVIENTSHSRPLAAVGLFLFSESERSVRPLGDLPGRGRHYLPATHVRAELAPPGLPICFRLPQTLATIPPGGFETLELGFEAYGGATTMALRVQSAGQSADFFFRAIIA